MRKGNVRPKRMQQGKTKATTGAPKGRKEVEEEEELTEMPTELALGSDGRIYVNAEGVDPALLAGRKVWKGFAMTPEESEVAAAEIHRLAFNVTVSVQGVMSSKKKR